jgi:hypothetical protein
MNREDFAAFAAKTLDDVIQLAEEKCADHIVGAHFLNKMAGREDHWSADKPFGFITPEVAKPH